MTVTAIEAISKTRSKVFLDGVFAFVLYKGELHKYQIREGEEISDEALHELQTQVLPKRAKLRAMNLLKSRQYTEKQLMDKLLLGGYSRENAQQALDYVKSYRYVDDAGYAYDYMTSRMESHSMKEIEQKLMQKGISKELIREALDRHIEQDGLPDERGMIRKLLEKKNCVGRKLEEKEKQRIYGYLYRKGFSQEAVRQAMREMQETEADATAGADGDSFT